MTTRHPEDLQNIPKVFTVGQLIKALSKFDPDALVCSEDSEYGVIPHFDLPRAGTFEDNYGFGEEYGLAEHMGKPAVIL